MELYLYVLVQCNVLGAPVATVTQSAVLWRVWPRGVVEARGRQLAVRNIGNQWTRTSACWKIQSTLNISNSDISNSAKLKASIWIKNIFWLLSPTIWHWRLFYKSKLIYISGTLNLYKIVPTTSRYWELTVCTSTWINVTSSTKKYLISEKQCHPRSAVFTL